MQHTTNCSNDSSNSSLLTPTPPGCSTGDNGFLTTNFRDSGQRDCATEFEVHRVSRTVFYKQIDVDLLKGNAHAGTLEIRQHDKLDIGRSFVVVQLVLIGGVGDEAIGFAISAGGSRGRNRNGGCPYLSSSPPSLRTMFRRENTVPKTNFASSSLALTV